MLRPKARGPVCAVISVISVGALLLAGCSSGGSGTHAAGRKSTAPTVLAPTPTTAHSGFTAYVTNAEDNGKSTGLGTVFPINLSSGEPGTAIPIGAGAGTNDLIVTSDGKTGYVTNEDTNSVTSIDLASGKLG